MGSQAVKGENHDLKFTIDFLQMIMKTKIKGFKLFS